ncbi:hypothetical protein HBP99_16005 [Listeria booriae]|uniref:hypothetical protein n=1 Tax=Listeria booriae TaxID=1552123 RepID=UPI001625E255|nr:hypothetical protein [Listeria booriae]MBC2370134.1 hypothetical protein [Listeria booriae]
MQTLEFWNLIIASVGLIAAVYAIIYTHLANRVELAVNGAIFDRRENDPYIVHFTINNLSSKPVTIDSIKFISITDNNELKPLRGVEPTRTFIGTGPYKIPDIIHPSWYENPVSENTILQPNSNKEFSYYFNPFMETMKIEISIKKNSTFSRNKIAMQSFITSFERDN